MARRKAESDPLPENGKIPDFFPSVAEVARFFGVARQTVHINWRMERPDLFPKGEKGFPSAPLITWRNEKRAGHQARATAVHDGSTPTASLNASKARESQLRADKLQLQIAILNGSFVAIEQIRSECLTMFVVFREKMLGIGKELAFELAGLEASEIEARIDARVEKILTELAEHDYKKALERLKTPMRLDDAGEVGTPS